MKLKVSISTELAHTAAITALSWRNVDELFTCGDDKQLYNWSTAGGHPPTRITTFKGECYPTDLQVFPRLSGSVGKHGDLFLMTASNGQYHIINPSGMVEKTVDAHYGAVLVGQWSNDGVSLLTAGEDGSIKIWSRGGMLRSIIVSGGGPIYGACWSPDSQSIVYIQDKQLIVKALAPNTKPIKFRGHDSQIICLAWSPSSNIIVSGSEDRRYKVWNHQGHLIFTSSLHESPITSVAWTPNGDLFAVSSYNTLRLCDSSGWSICLMKSSAGSIYKLTWSPDGSQLGGACANGSLLLAAVIGRTAEYKNYTATLHDSRTIKAYDIVHGAEETLDVSERVIHFALRYDHLVLTTPSQCYVYSKSNWNTPTIFDMKDGFVVLLLLCEKHFVLVERNSVSVYNYQGRLIASPRWPNMQLDMLRDSLMSASPDTIAVCDTSNLNVVHIIDIQSSRSVNDSTKTVTHACGIKQIGLDQMGTSTSRNLVILDKNRDLFVTPVRSSQKVITKVAGQIQTFKWNSEQNILGVIRDTRLEIWYCPVAYFDQGLLKLSSLRNDSDLGKNARIHDFVGNNICIRRTDGSLIKVAISPYPLILHSYTENNKWSDALNLARFVDETDVWTCLAVLVLRNGNLDDLDIAEEAFAAINQFDKVMYLKKIRDLAASEKKAAIAILLKEDDLAESILLHNGLADKAMDNHMALYHWSSSLDLATKYKKDIDVVLEKRKKYLEMFNKDEINNNFILWNNKMKETANS